MARVVRPNREQLRWDLVDPEAWLAADDRARLVWGFIETLDLGPLYEKVKARDGEPGRPPADPAVQLALWLLATIEGVGSARELDRLSDRDLAYRWLCCGVPAVAGRQRSRGRGRSIARRGPIVAVQSVPGPDRCRNRT